LAWIVISCRCWRRHMGNIGYRVVRGLYEELMGLPGRSTVSVDE